MAKHQRKGQPGGRTVRLEPSLSWRRVGELPSVWQQSLGRDRRRTRAVSIEDGGRAEPCRAPQPRQRSNPSRCNAMCTATPFEAGTDTFKDNVKRLRPGRSCGGTMLSHKTVARKSIACAALRRCCCLQPGWEFAQPRARFAPCSLRSAAAPTVARTCAPPPPHPTAARSHLSPDSALSQVS